MPLMCGVRTTDLWQKYLILRRQNVWLRPTLHFHPPFHAGGMLSGLYAAICSACMYVCAALVEPLLSPSILNSYAGGVLFGLYAAICSARTYVCMYVRLWSNLCSHPLFYYAGGVSGLYAAICSARMYVCMYGSGQIFALTLYSYAGGVLSGLYATICSARMYVCTALVKPLLSPSILM